MDIELHDCDLANIPASLPLREKPLLSTIIGPFLVAIVSSLIGPTVVPFLVASLVRATVDAFLVAIVSSLIRATV